LTQDSIANSRLPIEPGPELAAGHALVRIDRVNESRCIKANGFLSRTRQESIGHLFAIAQETAKILRGEANALATAGV